MEKDIYSKLKAYFNLWNHPEPDRLKEKDLTPFVEQKCVNRFGEVGPLGMLESIRRRREAFPDLKIKLKSVDLINPYLVQANLQFLGTYKGAVGFLQGKRVKVETSTKYLLSNDKKIFAAKSNMQEGILRSLGIDPQNEEVMREVKGEF